MAELLKAEVMLGFMCNTTITDSQDIPKTNISHTVYLVSN